MDIAKFDFILPQTLIAQTPSEQRQMSRLLVYHRQDKSIEDKQFFQITDYFSNKDVLVRNNTKVIPARLYGVKVSTGAVVEVLLLDPIENNTYRCLVGNAKVVKVETVIQFGHGQMTATCTGIEADGIRIFKFQYQGLWLEVLQALGEVPLPPYIKTKLQDPERYQTVYAQVPGSVAAPTAGLHFTETILSQLQAKDVMISDITLRIGLGTFKPVKVHNIHDHPMHAEYYQINASSASLLNQAKQQEKKITAIGTTSLRTLEANLLKYQTFQAEQSQTNIFITPGFQFKAVDRLLTNFHLPKSTLVMLISALIGVDEMQRVYRHAIDKQYRFFSFGDAMLIL